MPEIIRKIQPVLVNYACDTCKTHLKMTGQCLTSYPPLYVHICPKCEDYYQFNQKYPEVRYEDAE